MSKETSIGKQILLDFLDFLRFKVENDRLTLDEIDSIVNVIEDSIVLNGTVDDFAEHYHKTKDCVKVNICRKMLAKPMRKVLYSFQLFQKIIPESWKLHVDD